MIANAKQANRGPLAARDVSQIFERIMDVMRSIQKNEIVPDAKPPATGTEIDSREND